MTERLALARFSVTCGGWTSDRPDSGDRSSSDHDGGLHDGAGSGAVDGRRGRPGAPCWGGASCRCPVAASIRRSGPSNTSIRCGCSGRSRAYSGARRERRRLPPRVSRRSPVLAHGRGNCARDWPPPRTPSGRARRHRASERAPSVRATAGVRKLVGDDRVAGLCRRLVRARRRTGREHRRRDFLTGRHQPKYAAFISYHHAPTQRSRGSSVDARALRTGAAVPAASAGTPRRDPSGRRPQARRRCTP